MSSKKVIDIANSLEFIRDYNSNGITGSNSRLSTSENGELFLYYNNSSSNSSKKYDSSDIESENTIDPLSDSDNIAPVLLFIIIFTSKL